MLSSRYAIPTIVLLLLALVPTILHSYIGATYNDQKTVHAIASEFKHLSSRPSQRNDAWGKDVYGSDDWFERIYLDKQGNKVRLFVARSFDQKRLYHHPELALSYGQNFTKKSISSLPDHPDIPVYLLAKDDNSELVAYVLLYDDKFIKDPIKHQFSDSLRLLFNARKPMTLFYASQIGPPSNTPFSQATINSLLSQAIQSFRFQTNAI